MAQSLTEPEKTFYQGILQIAVACYHLENYGSLSQNSIEELIKTADVEGYFLALPNLPNKVFRFIQPALNIPGLPR